MTAQGNALGWRTSRIIIALKGRNMEVKSEKRIEKKIISPFTTIVLALTGRLFAWGTPLPRALPWAVYPSRLRIPDNATRKSVFPKCKRTYSPEISMGDSIMLRPYRPEFKLRPFYKFQQYS
jgi:hypothetical protein